MPTTNVGESASILYLTPLYHFSSDAPQLVIDQGIRIRKFGDCPTSLFDEEMPRYETVFSKRASDMTVDYFILRVRTLTLKRGTCFRVC